MTWPTENVQALTTASGTYNPANMVADAQVTTTLAVPGAEMGDFVLASFSLDLQGVELTAYISTADVVTAVFHNGTAGDIDLASGTLRVKVIKQ
jgi:predicted Zn-dependent protease